MFDEDDQFLPFKSRSKKALSKQFDQVEKSNKDFMPLHRRNHSLFGNKWTHGKWAQAGGKKQSSFKVPLFNYNQAPLISPNLPSAPPILNYQQMGMQETPQSPLIGQQPFYPPPSPDMYLGGQLR